MCKYKMLYKNYELNCSPNLVVGKKINAQISNRQTS